MKRQAERAPSRRLEHTVAFRCCAYRALHSLHSSEQPCCAAPVAHRCHLARCVHADAAQAAGAILVGSLAGCVARAAGAEVGCRREASMAGG